MSWTVDVTKRARKGLKALEPKVALQIIDALNTYAATGRGDIKRLQGTDKLRLRIREWRVIFMRIPALRDPTSGIISVLDIEHRREAYR